MKYSKQQLKEMAIEFKNSKDNHKKAMLVAMMQMFTGLTSENILARINKLADS